MTAPAWRSTVERRVLAVAIGGIKVQKYSAFLREIVVPTNFNIVSIKPLRGSGLIVCDRCTDIHNPNVVRASTGPVKQK